MADEADRAQEQDEFLLSAAIARARCPTGHGYSMGICLGCGEEIPARRLAAMPGCTYCVECQELKGRGRL